MNNVNYKPFIWYLEFWYCHSWLNFINIHIWVSKGYYYYFTKWSWASLSIYDNEKWIQIILNWDICVINKLIINPQNKAILKLIHIFNIFNLEKYSLFLENYFKPVKLMHFVTFKISCKDSLQVVYITLIELTTSKSYAESLYWKSNILQMRKRNFLEKLHHIIMLPKVLKFLFCVLRKRIYLWSVI